MKFSAFLSICLLSLALTGCEEKPITYPEVNIEFLSTTGNIGSTKEYFLRANVSGATIAKIDGEEVKIISGIIEKKLILEDRKKTFNIQAYNSGNSTFEFLSLSREDTEEEQAEATRLQEEIEIKKKRIEELKKNMKIQYDEFEKINWINHKNTPKYDDVNDMHIYIGKSDDGTVRLRFRIHYTANDWLFIKTYKLLIDGETVDIEPKGSVSRDHYTHIWEFIDEKADTKLIEKILKGKDIKIRHIGRYTKDRTISKQEITRMKEVYELYKLLKEKT